MLAIQLNYVQLLRRIEIPRYTSVSHKYCPLYECNWFTIILELLVGLTSSNICSLNESIDDVRLSFSVLLLHCMTCRLSAGASHKGHTSESLEFHSFIFSLVSQNLDTFFVIQIFWSKGSNSFACLISFQSIFSFWLVENRPCFSNILKCYYPEWGCG